MVREARPFYGAHHHQHRAGWQSGRGIAGGLGTMRITERVSALGNGHQFHLVSALLPRIVAACMFPLLVGHGAVHSGRRVSGRAPTGVMTSRDYVRHSGRFYSLQHRLCFDSSVVFAFWCVRHFGFQGYYTWRRRWERLTPACTNSIIAILLADFALAALLL
jgi:phospholipid/cholesterol/gamma-HCH transport system permease protein